MYRPTDRCTDIHEQSHKLSKTWAGRCTYTESQPDVQTDRHTQTDNHRHAQTDAKTYTETQSDI